MEAPAVPPRDLARLRARRQRAAFPRRALVRDPLAGARRLIPRGPAAAALGHLLRVFSNPAMTWADLVALRGQTKLPFLAKGILDPDDARRARDAGYSAVGAQLDRWHRSH
ncbi:MAG: alpha-hydroxy-acid oxidizing protein [Thermoanaerobaculia bacterium]